MGPIVPCTRGQTPGRQLRLGVAEGDGAPGVEHDLFEGMAEGIDEESFRKPPPSSGHEAERGEGDRDSGDREPGDDEPLAGLEPSEIAGAASKHIRGSDRGEGAADEGASARSVIRLGVPSRHGEIHPPADTVVGWGRLILADSI